MTVSTRSVGLVTLRVSSSKVDLEEKSKQVRKEERELVVPLGVAVWDVGNHFFIWNELFRAICGKAGVGLGTQGMDKGNVKHVERAGGYFSDDVMVGVGRGELYGGKLVAITRDDDDVGDRMESGEKGSFLFGIGSPRVDLSIVCPERGEWDGGDDEFEGRGMIDLVKPFVESGELKVTEHGGGLLRRRSTVTAGVHDEESDVTVLKVVKVLMRKGGVVIGVGSIDGVGV